jgi:autotransporter-associated beta strand protein
VADMATNTLTANANMFFNAAVSSAAGAQTLNSLTFATGGSLSITATSPAYSTVQLDSGGVLARANASITGNSRGLLSGANTFNRELIFHVLSGATLDVGTAANPLTIYNVSGLTKAGNGILSLNTSSRYLGTTTVNGGTLRFGAALQTLNNALFTTFTTAPGIGALSSAPSTQAVVVNYGGTVDLNGSNQTIANLTSTGVLPGTGGNISNSSATAATLRIGTSGSGTWAGNISNTGTINLLRDGGSTWTVVSSNTMSGSITLQGGTTTLQDSGAFLNASDLTIRRAALVWNDNGINADSRLASTMPITLNGGGLVYQARTNTNGDIHLGDLTLAGGASVVTVTPSAGTASVTFNSLSTPATGATVAFVSGGAMGSNGNVLFSTVPTLVNGIIGGWAVAQGTDPAANGSANLEFATYETAAGVRLSGNYITTLTSSLPSGVALQNTNVKIGSVTGGGTVTIGVGGATVNSITMNTGAANLFFTLPEDLLVVKSGGILGGLDNNTRTIGSVTAGRGRITAGQGQSQLYLTVGQNALNVNSDIINNNTALNLVISGVGQTGNNPTVSLLGRNTYTGTTYVNGVNVNLGTTRTVDDLVGGNSVPGNLIISGGTNATDSLPIGNATVAIAAAFDTLVSPVQANQIADTASVTINGGARLQLNRWNETIGSLIFNNDGGSNSNTAPSIDSAGGILKVTGTITANDHSSSISIPVMNGFLDVSSGQTFNIAANSRIPGQVGLAVNAALIGSGTITKTGAGILGIGGQSPFSGLLDVTQGGVAFTQATAHLGLGRVNLASGTTLDARAINSGLVGSITGSGSVINTSINSVGTVVTGYDNLSNSFDGVFNSPFVLGRLNVQKIGTGTWTLNGDSSTAAGQNTSNTFTVSQGAVLLNSNSARLNFINYNLIGGGVLNQLRQRCQLPSWLRHLCGCLHFYSGNGAQHDHLRWRAPTHRWSRCLRADHQSEHHQRRGLHHSRPRNRNDQLRRWYFDCCRNGWRHGGHPWRGTRNCCAWCWHHERRRHHAEFNRWWWCCGLDDHVHPSGHSRGPESDRTGEWFCDPRRDQWLPPSHLH